VTRDDTPGRVTSALRAAGTLDPDATWPDEDPDEAEPVGRRARITWASDITIRPVVWAWTDGGEGRIPTGSLSIAAGREGTGKSTFGIWMAAQITRGTLPGSLYGTPRRVLYVAVEDSWEHTIAPRLAAAGADLSIVGRFDVINFEGEEVTLALPHDNALLEQSITEHAVALVSMDPLMSFMGEGIDTHVTRSVRRALDPLARIADRTACLMLGIAHFNKGNATDPSSLITGSGAFKDVPRSVFGFVRDGDADDGSRVMTQTKNSLGRDDLPSLRYVIEDAEIPTEEGPAHVGRLSWQGVSERTAGDILRDANTTPEDRDERADAATWLRSFLDDQDGSANAKSVQDAGKVAGFSLDSLKRAKGRAGVRSSKGAAGWLWTVDPPTADLQGSKGATKQGAIDACSLAPLTAGSDLPDTCRSCGEVLFLRADGRDQCERCRIAERRAS